MSRTTQLALDLGHRSAHGRADFLVAPCNAEAVAWIDRWPDWPGPALVMHGPPGCGKTHLAQVWRARTGAADFDPAGASVSGDAFIAEGADALAAAGDVALFHLYNRLAASGGHLLLTARIPPARWSGRLPDLVSRLAASPTVAIDAPDDALIAAVLIKLFADRQLRVGAGVVAYLATHMERSFAAAGRLVAAADGAALAQRREITVPLVREILAAEADGRAAPLTP